MTTYWMFIKQEMFEVQFAWVDKTRNVGQMTKLSSLK